MSFPDSHRICLTLHYDGGAFFGWQLQPDQRTVQGEIERVLSRLLNAPARIVGSGRTDRGVHATGQVAAVDTSTRWTPSALRRALNSLLPTDIWVSDARLAAPGFHPRYGATRRAYVYRVGLAPQCRSPFHARWCWPLVQNLNRGLMDEATARIVGDHSFRAFAKAGQEERGDRCVVHSAGWREWTGMGLELHIAANRFLHHMVRYLTGTLVDIGLERRPLEDMERLLDREGGLETSPPAPPEGLFLSAVEYPPELFGPEGPPPRPATADLP